MTWCQTAVEPRKSVILREPLHKFLPLQDLWRRPKDLAGRTEGLDDLRERLPYAGGEYGPSVARKQLFGFRLRVALPHDD